MLWYSLEAPCRGASNENPQHMFYLALEEAVPELSSNAPPKKFF